MKILVDEDNYLTCFCIDSELENGIEVNTPDNIDSFIDTFRAYKYENGSLVLDVEKLEVLNNEHVVEELRYQREKACFPYVNRGYLWYNRLTEEQKSELGVWYQAWLDVTDTKVIPETPNWLV